MYCLCCCTMSCYFEYFVCAVVQCNTHHEETPQRRDPGQGLPFCRSGEIWVWHQMGMYIEQDRLYILCLSFCPEFYKTSIFLNFRKLCKLSNWILNYCTFLHHGNFCYVADVMYAITGIKFHVCTYPVSKIITLPPY